MKYFYKLILSSTVYLLIIDIIYFLFIISTATLLKEYFNYDNLYILGFTIFTYPFILIEVFTRLNDDLLGGHIHIARISTDPESWFILLGMIPLIGVFIISIRIHQKLNQLKKEMKNKEFPILKTLNPYPENQIDLYRSWRWILSSQIFN
ncbi:MAG: hypothetical protein HC932_00275 [Thermales bacterium]|nr:hypothetical protein [Thermales bacterium]